MRAFLPSALFLASLLLVGIAPAQTPDVYDAVSAAWDGDVETVQGFLDAGGDVNTQTGDGTTVLIRAADGGQADLVRILLDAGQIRT